MPFIVFFVLAISVGYVVFLINYTEVVEEYGKVAAKYLKLEEYKEWKKGGGSGYPTFVREKYSSFWSRMFGCPYCLIGFSSLVLHTLLTSFCLFLAGAFVSTLVWGLCTLLYFAVNKNYE